MKKCLYLLFPALLLLASCQQYGNSVVSTYNSQLCLYRPIDAATLDSAAKGWVDIDSNHAGNPSVCAVLVKVEPSWSQKWEIAKANGSAVVAYILFAAAIISIGVGIYFGNKGGSIPLVVGSFVLAIVLCWFAASSIDWAITKEAELPKALYDSLMSKDGNLKAFWDQNLLK